MRTTGDATKRLLYYYDATGVCGFNYNCTEYYYQKNTQGDIVKVYNASGSLVAEYKYDAWGKCKVVTNTSGIAEINPWRYRGYYYDNETGLYYCNSRYYDVEVGRWLNADTVDYLDPESINGLNLYLYCLNNPIMNYDNTGHGVLSIIFIFAAFAVIGGIIAINNNMGIGEAIGAILLGTLIGLAVAGIFLSVVGGIALMFEVTYIFGVSTIKVIAIGMLAYFIRGFCGTIVWY